MPPAQEGPSGLDRPPFRNELGQKHLRRGLEGCAGRQWLKDSVKFINTYRVDLASSEGQKFMAKQCAIYFGFEEGETAQTACDAERRPTTKDMNRSRARETASRMAAAG